MTWILWSEQKPKDSGDYLYCLDGLITFIWYNAEHDNWGDAYGEDTIPAPIWWAEVQPPKEAR